MTNKTELPDLDRLEALARAATPGPWHWNGDTLMAGRDCILWPDNAINAADGVLPSWAERLGSCGTTTEVAAEANARLIAAANPAAVLALIALARRAQPEGEAPQAADQLRDKAMAAAEEWANAEFAHANNLGKGGPGDANRCNKAELACRAAIEALAASAAQHAESGAQADGQLKLSMEPVPRMLRAGRALHEHAKILGWQDDGEGAFEYVQRLSYERGVEDARAALAAQSQGAQAAPGVERGIEYIMSAIASYANSRDERELERIQGMVAEGERARAALAAKAEAPALTPLDYRAQGREEALAIILSEDAENPFADHTNSVFGGEDYSTEWDEAALRELLHIGDRKHDAYDRAEAAYWDSLGHKEEAKREMLLVEQAPFYKPLNDFLSKHEAWDLMADLKRAQQAAAPGALDFRNVVDMKRTSDQGLTLTFTSARACSEFERGAAAPSAPGTPEAPADLKQRMADALNVTLWLYRRLPGAYGRPPFVDAALLEMAKIADIDAPAAIKERAAQLDGGQEVKHG